MRCEHLHDSAVYVLGALSPPEREAYERHLVECADCRAEVAEFADLPSLLGRIDTATAEALLAEESIAGSAGEPAKWAGPTFAAADARWAGPTVAPENGTERLNGQAIDPLLPRVLDRAQRVRKTERRRRRWQTAGAALVAACLGVLAVLGVRAVGAPASPDYVAMQEVAATVPVTAGLALEPIAGGTLVHMQCAYKEHGAKPGTNMKWTYKMFVVAKSGEAEELETWTAGDGDKYEVTASSKIARDNIQRIEIRKGDGTQLLVYNA